MNSLKKFFTFKIKDASELLFVTVWVFVICSIFGYVFEVSVSYLTLGYSEGHQGILYLPMTPIYGLGFLLMLVLLDRINDFKPLTQYLFCSFTGGLFESICGLVQIYFYHSRSWDYSNLPLNIFGLTTIPYALIWGLLGFSFIKVWPFLRKHLMKLKNRQTMVFTRVVFVFLLCDAILSTAICIRASERAKGIDAHHIVDQWMDQVFDDELIQDQWPGMKFK